MKHALVTGAAGFVGSHLVDRLLTEGWRITALDNFDAFYDRSVKEKNVEGHRTHATWTLVEADISDLNGLRSILKGGYDVIVHLAAKAGIRPSLHDPIGYQRVNVCGTQNLLECARDWGTKQFVFASSSSVYGVNPRVPWREADTVLLPISPYASTKVSGELLGHVYSHLYGIRFLALRLFSVYGPRQRPDLAIHRFARLMLAGRPIQIYGDGETRRDYTYVDDVTRGIRAAMEYRGTGYEAINLGNNRTIGLAAMADTVARILGVKAVRELLPDQPGDVPETWADIDKARRLLDYHPQMDFEQGVTRFTDWLRQARHRTV